MNLLRMTAMRRVRALQAWIGANHAVPPVDSFLLLEIGDFLLLESGDKLILEP